MFHVERVVQPDQTGEHISQAPSHQPTRSRWRSVPKLTNLIFHSIFVRMVSPEKPNFLTIPGLCRTENLPKLLSFSVNPSEPR